MRHLLYRSFDEKLSATEKQNLDRALEQSVELQAEKENLIHLRENLSFAETASFKPFFAERVTNRVKEISRSSFAATDFFESLNFLFKRVAIVGSIAAVVLFSVNVFSNNSNINSHETATRNVTLEEDFYSNYLASMEEVL